MIKQALLEFSKPPLKPQSLSSDQKTGSRAGQGRDALSVRLILATVKSARPIAQIMAERDADDPFYRVHRLHTLLELG